MQHNYSEKGNGNDRHRSAVTDSSTKQPKKKQKSGATFAAQQQKVLRTPAAEAAPTSIAQDVPNIKQIWDLSDDGETLTLNFHPGQSKAYRCEKRYTIVLAGTQAGKTSFGPWWMYKQILKYGSADYLAVTSSFELFKLKMGPMLRETFITILGIGRWWAGDRLIELANPATKKFGIGTPWGRIILRSAVNKSGLESATAAAAWLDEAGQNEFSLDVWDAVIRRLSLYQGPVLVTTTIYNLGWLKYYLYDPWVKGEWPNMEIIQFASTMNPGFGQDEFTQRKRKMQSHRFAMQYEGRFTDIPGQIYHLPQAQRITPFKPGDRWPRYCGVDFGAVNTATLWIAYDEHGAAGYGREVYFVYRAAMKGDRTTHDHAKAMQQEDDFRWLVAAFGGSPSEEQQRRDWMFEGVPIAKPPVWDVEAGIDRVTYAIREQRLYVMDDPTNAGLQQVLWEVDNYRRETNEYGEVMERIEGKAAFHLMDALRYVMSGVIYYGEHEGNVMEHPMA